MAVSIPDDIMLLIFSRLVRSEDAEDEWPAMMYDRHAAQAPFTLAAVCQRWRELASTTSTLWTYFGFPPAEMVDERFLLRLELLKRRAGAAPIDVVFGWQSQADARACRREPSRLVFEEIVGMHVQWKTVVLHVEESVQSCRTMDRVFQSSQWPLLESLSLSMNGITTELPVAPLLHRLWLSCDFSTVNKSFIEVAPCSPC